MLEQLPLPVELLELEDIKILDIKIKQNEIFIKVESTKQETLCHECNQPTKTYGYGSPLTLRHLPILGKNTYIEIKPRRGICETCDKGGKTTTQTLPWHNRNGHYTKAYEQHVLLSLISSTIVDVSIKENISEHAIQNVINRQVDDQVFWDKINRIGVLGIDEISLKKGHKDFVTIITSRIDNEIRILKVIKGRLKQDVVSFFKSISAKKVKTIIAVCSDMYEGFVNAAKEVFGNKIPVVVDRFHVASMYRKCLTSLRKKELKRLKKILPAQEYKDLHKAILILKKNKEMISGHDEEELEKLFKHSPLLRSAYSYCRELTHIFNSYINESCAKNKIRNWISSVNDSDLSCFNTFITTIEKYEGEICNYFTNRFNSGFVEGINNKIKVIKRRCYGITNIKNLFQRIYLDLSGYKIFGASACMEAYA